MSWKKRTSHFRAELISVNPDQLDTNITRMAVSTHSQGACYRMRTRPEEKNVESCAKPSMCVSSLGWSENMTLPKKLYFGIKTMFAKFR